MNRPLQIALVIIAIAAVLGAATFALSAPPQKDRETLYQVGSLGGLMDGEFDGIATIGDLLAQGDTGLGTFHGLNGEMIVLDGRCFRALPDGTVQEVGDDETTPFAQVTRFDVDGTIALMGSLNLSALGDLIETSLPTTGTFVMIKITGTFDDITVRSVPQQSAPYPPLADVVKNQTVFRYSGIEGTMVGLWSPEDSAGLSSAELHFHFVSSDHSRGGHVLDVNLTSLSAQWDQTARYVVSWE